MKTTIAILLLSVSTSVMAQTARVVNYTNRFATFTNLQGKAYERVELAKADEFSIIYRTESGAGRVYFTNLAPAVLGQLGLDTNSALMASKLDAELTHQKEVSKAEEQERSLNPLNWKEVHVREITRQYGGGIECSVREISRRIILRNPPTGLLAYWSERQNLVQSMTRLNTEVQQSTARIQQLANQTSNFASRIKQREYNQQLLEATAITGAYGDPAMVDAQMNRTTSIRQARVKLDADKDDLGEMQEQLSGLQKQLPLLRDQLNNSTTQLKELDADGLKTTAIKVFFSSGTYLGIPVLVFKEYSTRQE